ncbi:hypothetical protein CKAH01_07166 [Colletotrichum kahawae]|uniref:Ankyrin repeat protein n=1 Tax=Colletotrichum kahawae TaxID=34407 RepID=A0AAD9Y6L4_COLKA|nr:hypothetical protein CKAH01_07166 [Colletotrichum kahawae]
MDNSHADRPGPLYLSVERRSEEMTRVLLKANMDPNESNYLVKFGRSPLQKAVEDGNLQMIDLLLQAGADVNTPAAKTRGATALQLAAIKGRLGIAKRLIELKANVNAPGAETHGRTALEGAAEHGRLDMVQLLLDCGANVAGSGRLQYLKAIRLANDQGHTVMADFLENLRAWLTLDYEIWDMVIRLKRDDYWGELEGLCCLEEFIANSAESPSSNYRDGDSPEETESLGGNSDDEYNSGTEESFRQGIVVRGDDVRVEGRPALYDLEIHQHQCLLEPGMTT